MELYESGELKAFIVFDGKGSNNGNWFSQSRLLDSSWSLLREMSTNTQFESFNLIR